MKPHKHAELIKAWADGAEIECLEDCNSWIPVTKPIWREDWVYRIKPEPKPDIIRYASIGMHSDRTFYVHGVERSHSQIKLYFDGETMVLKNVEMVK